MKRFAAGNIITWGDIGCPPVGITKGRFYKVNFMHEYYSNAIKNDRNEYTFNFNGFVEIEEYMWDKHKMRRGTKVELISNNKQYIIDGFDSMITEVLINLTEVK